MVVLELILLILATLVAVPLIVLFVECLAALKKSRVQSLPNETPTTAILMPAHNEELVIGKTLAGLTPHLNNRVRAVVIADNCSDGTADIIRGYPVELLERFDDEKRGKGYALDHGLRHLAQNPPDIVVMLDADCSVEADGVAHIAKLAQVSGRPVQAVYLMKSPVEPSTNDLVSAFAFKVKNLVRPKGLYNLGQPCLLTGTGMAFPWHVIKDAPIASGNIVEDMQLGFDLALDGTSPLLAVDALVWGELPQQEAAATTQRTRWEHGHMQTLLTQCPRLIKGALKTGRFDLMALGLDLLVPPLALLVFLWLLTFFATFAAGLLSLSWVPAIVSGTAGLLLFVAITTAWYRFGRKIIPLGKLLSVPFYVAWKIPLYLKFLFQRQTAWVRTDRD